MRVQRSVIRLATLNTLLLISLAGQLSAQVRSTVHPNSQAQREMQAREWDLTHIPDEINKRFKKEQISLFTQIRDDFTRLQTINNEMMQTVFVQRNDDRRLIAVATAEINKRAVRLSENLVLPETDEKIENLKPDETQNSNALPAGLLLLDRYIMSFVSNPLFKQPNIIESQNALKARSDLTSIIRLSDQLKKKSLQSTN
jgi:hypothetical protein